VKLPSDPAQRAAFWARGGRASASQREALRAQLEELYATASNLQNYVKANRTGFRKILKKHDKLTSVRSATGDVDSIIGSKPSAGCVNRSETCCGPRSVEA
jgi:hypothetical protein